MPSHSKTFFMPTVRPFMGIVLFCMSLIIFIFVQGLQIKILGVFALISSAYTIITYAPATLVVNREFLLIKNLLGFPSKSHKIAWTAVSKMELEQYSSQLREKLYPAYKDYLTSKKDYQVLNIIYKSGHQESIPLYLFQEDSVPFYLFQNIKKIVSIIQEYSCLEIEGAKEYIQKSK